MNPLEILAAILIVACVLLAVHRSLWQYPIGIAGTLLYVYIFAEARLYSSAALNVFFTLAQFYGWWFWTRGAKGGAPKITTWPWLMLAGVTVAGLAIAALLATLLTYFTDAALPLADSIIFGLSVAAQFLLDRKKIENWMLWGVVNALSVIVYAQQGLWPTAALYAGLFFNVFYGWHEWRKELRAYANTTPVSTAA